MKLAIPCLMELGWQIENATQANFPPNDLSLSAWNALISIYHGRQVIENITVYTSVLCEVL